MKHILFVGEGHGDIGQNDELPGRRTPIPRTQRRRKGKEERLRAIAAYEDTRGDLVYIVQRILPVGVAICEIEAWLLADRKALRGVFGHAIGDRSLPAGLEDIRDPKSLLSSYIGEFLSTSRPEGCAVDHFELKRALAENMDPNEVSRLCPRGFGPFRREVLERLLPLFE